MVIGRTAMHVGVPMRIQNPNNVLVECFVAVYFFRPGMATMTSIGLTNRSFCCSGDIVWSQIEDQVARLPGPCSITCFANPRPSVTPWREWI